MRRPGRWTLRTRLAVAAVALTAVALVLTNAVGLALLRGYLVDRLDDQLAAVTVGASLGRTAAGLPPPPESPGRGEPFRFLMFDRVTVARVVGERYLFRFSADGRLTAAFPEEPVNRPELGTLDGIRRGEPYTVPGTGGPSWRVMAVDTPDGGALVMTVSMAEVEDIQGRLLLINAGVVAAVLLLLGLAARALIRVGLRPLTAMEATAAHIAAGDFSRRVPESDPHTESGRLGTAMNVMLDRVEREIAARAESEGRMRRFLADASHELRTPLTSVRGFAELYRRGGTPPGPAMDETMRRIEDEAVRMGVLVGDMLALAHLDEERPLAVRSVDLLEIGADTIRDARARVPDRRVRLGRLDTSLGPVMVRGDEARLRQVVANLTANALAHTPPDAQVTLRVGVGTATARPTIALGADVRGFRLMGVLEVADTGPGIPPEHAPRVFERLYRVSESRARSGGGAGLGLAIVAAIVKAHGGRIELTTEPGAGATFRVLLPLDEVARREIPAPDSEPGPR